MQPLYGLHRDVRTDASTLPRDTGVVPTPPQPRSGAPDSAPAGRLVGAAERLSRRLVGLARRHTWMRSAALHPVVARPGYWLATLIGALWGGILSLGRVRRSGGVWVARRVPRWAFGRGGTTIGAVYLTRDAHSSDVLEHEAVHRAQWRRYGLALIPLYLEAGQDALTNRFEIEAGLEKGGYTRRLRPRGSHGTDGESG